jgi:hypothetical protein
MKEEVKDMISMEVLKTSNPYLYKKLREKFGDVDFVEKKEALNAFKGNSSVEEMIGECKIVKKSTYTENFEN